MLVRSTIFFILFSIQLLFAAPISHSPNTELERRGEVEVSYDYAESAGKH